MNKMVKIFSMLTVIMLVMVMMPMAVNADVDAGTILKGVTATNPGTEVSGVNTLVGRILGILQWVAIVGGVLVITVLGIKYMMGSLEEKAEYKKSMIPLVIGILVVVSATTIANFLFATFKVDDATTSTATEEKEII